MRSSSPKPVVERFRLEKLFNSLVTIILTYSNHLEASSFVVVPTTKEDASFNRSPSFDDETLDQLEIFISDTPTLSGKTNRTPLMLYILYGVNLLKPLVKGSLLLSAVDTEILNRQLVQLILNLQRLITLSASEHISVTYLSNCVTLSGCYGWRSASEEMIKSNLFIALSLSFKASEDTIKQYITDALNEQQHPLLFKRIEQLEKASESRQNEHSITRGKLLEAQEEIEVLKRSSTKKPCASAQKMAPPLETISELDVHRLKEDAITEASSPKRAGHHFGLGFWSKLRSVAHEDNTTDKKNDDRTNPPFLGSDQW